MIKSVSTSTLGIAILVSGVAVCALPAEAQTISNAPTDVVVISGSAFPESRSRIASAVQVIDQETIARNSGQSITDLLTEAGVGYQSERSAAQNQIMIRGAITDGQGRDFLSDVLVLIDGRRAGTANVSKLSLNDVARVEVVRGPASVIYGSGNIGGVVNIIMKNGRSVEGGTAFAAAGNWGLLKGHAEYGGDIGNIDYYAGVSAGSRGDYESGEGGGMQENSGWNRYGATFALGTDLNDNHRIDFSIRGDGCFDCGFRGSQANTYNRDFRANYSADLTYSGKTNDQKYNWSSHAYYVLDRDDYNWNSPVIVANNAPAPGTSIDNARRGQTLIGNQLRGEARLWEGATLLAGWDYQYQKLRSRRFRQGVPGTTLAQISPIDNNQHETTNAIYTEYAQDLLDDRLVVRGGLRYTKGKTTLDATPNQPLLVLQSADYDSTTYSAGITYKAADTWWLRAGASSGFRAPSATQLAGNFQQFGGGRVFGNPDLVPEESRQVEAGSLVFGDGWSLDTVLFQNVIKDRFGSAAYPGIANTSIFINNPAEILVRGIEVQATVDALKGLGIDGGGKFWNVSATAHYNLDMKDKGTNAAANTDNLLRAYRAQASISTQFGESSADKQNWEIGATAMWLGPMDYDPVSGPEYLIGPNEFNRNYFWRKDPYWVVNLTASIALTETVQLSGAIRNLFNQNESPSLFGLDKEPYLADPRFLNGGAPGSSMEGRNAEVRLTTRF